MVDITTADDLMLALRRSRIDREKLEAIENYIEHCTDDLQQLQDYMHEIMSLFVFQATRKLLLARLIQLHDSQADNKQKGKSLATQQKAENLAAAIKHADEEVRRLEYWSDIKGMAETGHAPAGLHKDEAFEGVDSTTQPKALKTDSDVDDASSTSTIRNVTTDRAETAKENGDVDRNDDKYETEKVSLERKGTEESGVSGREVFMDAVERVPTDKSSVGK